MSIAPLLLAFVSAALIVGGALMTLRDFRGRKPLATAAPPAPKPPSRRQLNAQQTSAAEPRTTPPRRSESNAEVTIVRRDGGGIEPTTAQTTKVAAGSAFGDLQSAVAAIAAEASPEISDTRAEGHRWPSVETRWLSVEPLVEQARQRINQLLAPVALQIGSPGEAGWGFKNRGYGTFRRVTIGGKSVAWVRAEINQENVVTFKVRAHNVEQALLNATSSTGASSAGPGQVLEALSQAIRPAAEYAAWIAPRRSADAEASNDAWSGLLPLTSEAFTIASGALREADADLSEVARATWDPATGNLRWSLAVDVARRRVADISVDLVKRSLELVSQLPANQRPDLVRKRRLDLDGLTAHSLAEAIAACAWPAVAEALERPDNPAGRS